MIINKTVKIPVHFETTKTKINILDNLTACITFHIRLISGLITEETKLDRTTIRKLVNNNTISEITDYRMVSETSASIS